MQNTNVATQPARSPTLAVDAQGNVTLNASGIMSASHIIWGTSVWADHIIWGTSTSAVDLTTTAINGEGAAVQNFQPNACPMGGNGD